MVRIIDCLSQQPKTTLLGLGIVFVILIGYGNLLAGVEISAAIFYLLPVSIVTWCAGKREGAFTALISSVAWYVADWYAGRVYSHPVIYYWNLAVMFGFFFIVSFTLSGLKNSLEKEKKLARIDSLTGVANTRSFVELASKEIERCRRYNHPVTLIYIDCDDFKNVNDHFGHQTGDRLLGSLANILQKNTRATDFVARLGGDEFVILMPETGEQIIPLALGRLKTRLVDSLLGDGWPVTLSMGAAIYLHPPESVNEMIKSADRLMFLAKNDGKNMIKHAVLGKREKINLPSAESSRSASETFPNAPGLPVAPGGLLPKSLEKSANAPRA